MGDGEKRKPTNADGSAERDDDGATETKGPEDPPIPPRRSPTLASSTGKPGPIGVIPSACSAAGVIGRPNGSSWPVGVLRLEPHLAAGLGDASSGSTQAARLDAALGPPPSEILSEIRDLLREQSRRTSIATSPEPEGDDERPARNPTPEVSAGAVPPGLAEYELPDYAAVIGAWYARLEVLVETMMGAAGWRVRKGCASPEERERRHRLCRAAHEALDRGHLVRVVVLELHDSSPPPPAHAVRLTGICDEPDAIAACRRAYEAALDQARGGEKRGCIVLVDAGYLRLPSIGATFLAPSDFVAWWFACDLPEPERFPASSRPGVPQDSPAKPSEGGGAQRSNTERIAAELHRIEAATGFFSSALAAARDPAIALAAALRAEEFYERSIDPPLDDEMQSEPGASEVQTGSATTKPGPLRSSTADIQQKARDEWATDDCLPVSEVARRVHSARSEEGNPRPEAARIRALIAVDGVDPHHGERRPGRTPSS